MPVQLSVKVVNAELVRKGLENLRRETPLIARQRIFDTLEKARKAIVKAPPSAHFKINFVSQKQRRYFFWALRKGIITVPYRRTGTYERGWRITRSGDTSYKLTGQAVQRGRDYTKWVGGNAYGQFQARIHRGRWTLARDAIDGATTGLPKRIDDNIRQVARRNNL